MYVSKCARENMKEREKGIVASCICLVRENQRAAVCFSHAEKKKTIYSPIKIAPTSL